MLGVSLSQSLWKERPRCHEAKGILNPSQPSQCVKIMAHAEEESRDIPLDENLTVPSSRETSPRVSIEGSVPVVVVASPSPQTSPLSSEESIRSLPKDSDYSVEKVLGPATTSILNEAEEEASNLMREETSHSASEADSPDKLHSLMNCRICQLFVRTVDRLLDKSEEMMDQYMPLTEEEICNLKQAVEELDVSSADHQKSDCFNRITALSYRLRQRAYMMALGKLRLTRRSTHSTLSQLHETLDLIEHAQQGEEPESLKNHQKLDEMCTHWTQRRESAREFLPDKQEEALSASCRQREAGAPLAPDGSPGEAAGVPGAGSTTEAGMSSLAAGRNTLKTGTPSAKDCSSDEAQKIFTTPACGEENAFASTEVESKTLEMSRRLTLDLKGTYENLLANLTDMPQNLKRKLYQTYGHVAELHAKFTTANSFADLPGSILERGLAIMAQAQDSMDEVMEFAFQNPMGILADDLPLAPVTTETHSAQPEEGDILKIQAAYDPKGCDEHD